MKCKNRPTLLRYLFVCVLVLGLNPLGAFAAEYFVATTGNDSNPGTIGNPFRTLEKAASVMVAGDTMYIRGGTYQRTAWDLNVPSGGGSWATATTVKAYDNEQVILTPQNPEQNGTDVIRLPKGKSYIIFDGLVLDGLRNGMSYGGRQGFRFADASISGSPTHHVRIINTEIRNTYSSNVLTTDAHHLEFINCHLHHANANDPNYKGTGPYGLYMSSGDNLVQGCEIHHNNGYGIHNYSGHDYWPHRNVFVGNRIYANGRSGIIVSRGNSIKIINNLFYGNGTGGTNKYTGSDRYGIRVWGQANDTLIYNNTTYDNGNGELDLSENTARTLVKNNIFFGTKSRIYTVNIHNGNTNSTLTHNTIYHANSGYRILNLGSATIADNNHDNPLFVNVTKPDFHLQSGSPAIGLGVVLQEVKVDFDNAERIEPYDIGAYAYGKILFGAPKNLVIIGKK